MSLVLPPARKRGLSLKKAFPGEWNSWRAMHERCSNPKYRRYDLYGGRGIVVCERWESFRQFLQDIGPKPTPKYTIERGNSDADYEPSNCRWATQVEQMRNTSKNRVLTFNGKTQCLSAWAEEMRMPSQVLVHRLNRGWSVERALCQSARTCQQLAAIEFRGTIATLRGWSRILGIGYSTLYNRLVMLEWPLEKAFTKGT